MKRRFGDSFPPTLLRDVSATVFLPPCFLPPAVLSPKRLVPLQFTIGFKKGFRRKACEKWGDRDYSRSILMQKQFIAEPN